MAETIKLRESSVSWIIYALTCPDTHAVRYVGYSRLLVQERLKYHLWDAKRRKQPHGKTRKARWIRSLIRRGVVPGVVVLQVGVGEWVAAERFWIATFEQAGMNLLNMTTDGRGVAKVSAARRRKLIADILDSHNARVDSLVEAFRVDLDGIVSAAQAHVLGELQKRLKITDGIIEAIPANLRILRQIDDYLTRAAERAGYLALVDEFVDTFNGQMVYFDQIIEALSGGIDIRVPRFAKSDLDYLAAQQVTAAEALGTVIDTAATTVKRRALMSTGQLPYAELVEQIDKGVSGAMSQAVTLADTSQATFFRTVTDRGFRIIERGLPDGAVKYSYEGPRDKFTRDFCRSVLARKAPLTRTQIERLDNGQIPNPFVSGGGWNCRHQWIIDEITKSN